MVGLEVRTDHAPVHLEPAGHRRIAVAVLRGRAVVQAFGRRLRCRVEAVWRAVAENLQSSAVRPCAIGAYLRGRDGAVNAIYLMDAAASAIPESVVVRGVQPARGSRVELLGVTTNLRWTPQGDGIRVALPGGEQQPVGRQPGLDAACSATRTRVSLTTPEGAAAACHASRSCRVTHPGARTSAWRQARGSPGHGCRR